MVGLVGTLAVLGWLVLMPTTAFAQTAIAGTARDAWGGVHPWTYVPAPRRALDSNSEDAQIRMTWQANPRHKCAGLWSQNRYCRCANSVSATLSPGVLGYHGADDTFNNSWVPNCLARRAVSYVTGSHNPKVDFTDVQNQPDTTEGYKFLVRGFIAMQIDRDQHDMGASQPLFPPPVPLPSTLRFTANQTQLGFGLEAPPLNQWTNRVYVELDFLSAAPAGADRLNSREPRMRQAFWLLGWSEDRSTLLVGQAPALFGDLVPNITWDNVSLAIGALAGKDPQVRYTHLQRRSEKSAVVFAASVNAPNSGLFNENTATAERSGLPSVQGKLAYYNAGRGTVSYFGFEDAQPSPLEIAVSGFLGAERAEPLTRDALRVVADGVAVSALVPIIGIRDNRRAGAVGIIAQAWIGKNIDAYFGGNGQGIYETAAGRVDGVVGRGFFAGANAFVSQNVWLSAFYSYERNNLPDLVNAGIPFRIASGAFSSSTFGSPGVGRGRDGYVAVWFNPLPSLYTGMGWDHRQANYNDGHNGRNNRFNLSVFYNFCTAQADRGAKLPWVCRTGGQTRDEGNPGQP